MLLFIGLFLVDILSVFLTFFIMASYFLHPCQFPSAELHHNQVQLRALPERLHPGSPGIALNLTDGFLPLRLGLLGKVFLGQIFDFEDIAVA